MPTSTTTLRQCATNSHFESFRVFRDRDVRNVFALVREHKLVLDVNGHGKGKVRLDEGGTNMQNERSVINDIVFLAEKKEAEHRAMVALRLKRAKTVFASKGNKAHWELPLELSGGDFAAVFQDVDSVLARCANEFYLWFEKDPAGLSERERMFLACCFAYEGMRECGLRNPYLHGVVRQSILNQDGSLRDVREAAVVFAMEVTGQAMLPMPEFQIVWEKLMAVVCRGEAHYYNWGESPECSEKYGKIADERRTIQEDLLAALHSRDRFGY